MTCLRKTALKRACFKSMCNNPGIYFDGKDLGQIDVLYIVFLQKFCIKTAPVHMSKLHIKLKQAMKDKLNFDSMVPT